MYILYVCIYVYIFLFDLDEKVRTLLQNMFNYKHYFADQTVKIFENL